MNDAFDPESWLWVLVASSGSKEQFLGLRDPEDDGSFIPVFREKGDAGKWMLRIDTAEDVTYEAQAIRYKELLRQMDEASYMLYLMDSRGKVLKKIKP